MTVRCDGLAPAMVRSAMSRIGGLGTVLGDAMLVATELINNALQHSRCNDQDLLTVRLTRDGCLRVAVVDPGRSGRTAGVTDQPAERGGLGLRIVAALASRWGSERRPDGYEVWAELALRP